MTARRPTLAEIREWPAVVDVAAAAALGVSRSTAYEAIRTNSFPAKVVEVSRRKVVVTATLVALLDGGGVEVPHAHVLKSLLTKGLWR